MGLRSGLLLALSVAALGADIAAVTKPPPKQEPIDVFELPLPPVAPSTAEGACTAKINPRRTGCINIAVGDFQAGDFAPDGNHVVANVEFVGAPAAPDPASIFTGQQLILIKADGTKFKNGDAWKCLSCGVPAANAVSIDPKKDYPHVFRGGKKALWGHNILDCGSVPLSSDACTPNCTHIYPIHWPISADGTGAGGSPREMRLHPDDVHMGWSAFTATGGQNAYLGRLEFNAKPTVGEPLAPRYDLVNVSLLVDKSGGAFITAEGSQLQTNHSAIGVGELRGFSGNGDEVIYIGPSWESSNIDLFAVHLVTGAVRRLTSHPDYADPIAFSHDNQWFVTMDTRVTERQMFMAGMRWVPPLVDLVAVVAASSTRNNRARRFFQPILIDRYGDRDEYYGQQVNAGGDGSSGSVNDPNWNGRADPAFSPDGTRITYWQALVVSPACGGVNPLPCPVSTAQGGRGYRIMVARLKSRKATQPAAVFKVPEVIPWAVPFPPGATAPAQSALVPGDYTMRGRVSGVANVTLGAGSGPVGGVGSVAVSYTNYSDQAGFVLNGYERVSVKILLPNVWENLITWSSDIVQTGVVNATKRTGAVDFVLDIDAETNIFDANGTLTTTIDGVAYKQPLNGA